MFLNRRGCVLRRRACALAIVHSRDILMRRCLRHARTYATMCKEIRAEVRIARRHARAAPDRSHTRRPRLAGGALRWRVGSSGCLPAAPSAPRGGRLQRASSECGAAGWPASSRSASVLRWHGLYRASKPSCGATWPDGSCAACVPALAASRASNADRAPPPQRIRKRALRDYLTMEREMEDMARADADACQFERGCRAVLVIQAAWRSRGARQIMRTLKQAKVGVTRHAA